MKLVIEIPEAFEGHFNQDRFKDSFERILEDCKHSAILSGIYEFETIEMLIRAFKNGTPLPKGHGRLKDIDAIMRELSIVSSRSVKSQMYIIRDAPTLIEADRGEEDGEPEFSLTDTERSFLGKVQNDINRAHLLADSKKAYGKYVGE